MYKYNVTSPGSNTQLLNSVHFIYTSSGGGSGSGSGNGGNYE